MSLPLKFIFKAVEIFQALLIIEFSLAILVFILLFYMPAPYGKHYRKGWGPNVPSRLAWILMELPAVLIPAHFFWTAADKGIVKWIFIIAWMSHYLYRTFIYSSTTNNPSKPFPLLIAFFGFLFNCLNGSVNGHFVFHTDLPTQYLNSLPLIGGLLIFYGGMAINKHSEFILSRLKRPKGEYVIPRTGLFGYISNPHYFGEIIEWLGWAIMTWSLAGLAFFIFTFANLFPRAMTMHAWYKENFSDYPEKRKAIIPYVI